MSEKACLPVAHAASSVQFKQTTSLKENRRQMSYAKAMPLPVLKVQKSDEVNPTQSFKNKWRPLNPDNGDTTQLIVVLVLLFRARALRYIGRQFWL